MKRSDWITSLRKWGTLAIGLFVIWAFVFIVAPGIRRFVPAVAQIHDYIDKHNIEATALIYTDVEEFSDADVDIRDAMQY